VKGHSLLRQAKGPCEQWQPWGPVMSQSRIPSAAPRSADVVVPPELLERVVLRKVSLRLLPFLFLLYVVNILDRVNVSFAKLKMIPDLGWSETDGERIYGLGAGIFYIGYVLFEVPSNLILHRVGARLWISRIMITWGVISAAMLFIREPGSFYLLRFLLGVAEAGFFPGIILYLSYWFPRQERARAVALFMMASPVCGLLGNPLSGFILKWMNGWAGFAGWQWLFLLEGIPSVVLGVVVWLYLTDRPHKAAWLSPTQRDWLVARIDAEGNHGTGSHGRSLAALAHPRLWLLMALYFTAAIGSNSFGFFGPTIIKENFPGRGEDEIGLLAALPNLPALIGMVVVGIHSDRTGERRFHVALSALLCAGGWWMSSLASSPAMVLGGLVLVQIGVMSMLPTFWALATSFLSGTQAAGGIAFINSLANLGGFLAPFLLGQLRASSGSFTSGMLLVATTMIVGALLAVCVRPHPPHQGSKP
jgi:MFS family permease